MAEPRPVLAMSSGGKDSLFMVEMLRRDPAWRLEGLVTTVNEANRRVAMHGTGQALLRAQADALGLTLTVVGLPQGCDNQEYERRLAAGLAAHRRAGREWIAIGDLFLEDIRQWREQSFARMGWRPVFPLWHTACAEISRRLIGAPWEAVVTCIDTRKMPENLLGRRYDQAFLDELPAGVDRCGENGEFHTFVRRAPGFSRALPIRPGRRVLAHERYLMLDLEPVDSA